MDKQERKTMVFCMEFLCRNLNDEEDLFRWLELGVADGDFSYIEMLKNPAESIDSVDEYYLDDRTFGDLMHTFLKVMRQAANPKIGGGLWCDGVLDAPFFKDEKHE